jgi:membrane protein DedA with SNARE-associated domain
MTRWIVHLIQSSGPAGVGVLMLLENVVVFIPSELIMPLAGFYAAIGRLNFWSSVIAGTIGAHLGSLGWYVLGRKLGKERFEAFVRKHGSWVGIAPQHVEKATRWFEGRGAMAILIGRLLPAIRTFISVPAGFARMPLPKFIPLSIAGTFVFNFLLAEAGLLLGAHFREVELWIRPISLTIVGVLFAWWLYRVVRAHM